MQETIPIFLHYPKCGGTSILIWMRKYLCFQRRDYTWKKELRVLDEKKNSILTLYVYTNDVINEKYLLKTDIEDLIVIPLSSLFVFFSNYNIHINSAVINPSGVRIFKSGFFDIFIKTFGGDAYKYFLSYRDPFDREFSLFTYLDSDRSYFETTHGVFNGIDFENYVAQKMTDSWLMTSLLDKDSHSLDENDFKNCLSLLKNVKPYKLENLNYMFREMFKESILKSENYNFAQELLETKHNVSDVNSPPTIHSLSPDMQILFKKKKFFEYKLFSDLNLQSQ